MKRGEIFSPGGDEGDARRIPARREIASVHTETLTQRPIRPLREAIMGIDQLR